MTSPLAVRLQLDTFEDRAVPSASGMGACIQVAPVAHEAEHKHEQSRPEHHHHHHQDCNPAPVAHAKQALKGWLAGQVTVEQTDPRIADIVPTMFLDGTAKLAGLGRVKVEGYVQGVGFMPQGQATGMITLTKIGDPKSTITLKLTGPVTPGTAPLPTQWTATVVAKTGSFSHIKGSTTLTLSITPDPVVTNRLTFHGYM
jgi:hypothetical protein